MVKPFGFRTSPAHTVRQPAPPWKVYYNILLALKRRFDQTWYPLDMCPLGSYTTHLVSQLVSPMLYDNLLHHERSIMIFCLLWKDGVIKTDIHLICARWAHILPIWFHNWSHRYCTATCSTMKGLSWYSACWESNHYHWSLNHHWILISTAIRVLCWGSF